MVANYFAGFLLPKIIHMIFFSSVQLQCSIKINSILSHVHCSQNWGIFCDWIKKPPKHIYIWRTAKENCIKEEIVQRYSRHFCSWRLHLQQQKHDQVHQWIVKLNKRNEIPPFSAWIWGHCEKVSSSATCSTFLHLSLSLPQYFRWQTPGTC